MVGRTGTVPSKTWRGPVSVLTDMRLEPTSTSNRLSKLLCIEPSDQKKLDVSQT